MTQTSQPQASPADVDDSASDAQLSVVVVNFNTRDLVLECIKHLKTNFRSTAYSIVVVDNASSDGSPAEIRLHHPDVKLIEMNSNIGFGPANNEGVKLGREEFVLLLNTDAFPEQGCIEGLLGAIRTSSDRAAVGPKLIYGDGTFQPSIHAYPSASMSWRHHLGISRLLKKIEKPEPPADGVQHDGYLKGACLLLRRKAFEAVDGFDPSFFFYGDEADLQQRLVRAGYSISYHPSFVCKHLEGKSGAANRARYSAHYFASNDRFIFKHGGAFALISHRLSVLLWCLIGIVKTAMLRRSPATEESLRFRRFMFHLLICPISRIDKEIDAHFPAK